MTQERINKTLSALEFPIVLSLLAKYATTDLGKMAAESLSPLDDKEEAMRENRRVELIQSFLNEGGSFDFHWFGHFDTDFFEYKDSNPVIEPELLYIAAKSFQEIAANQQLLESAAEEEPDYNDLSELFSVDEWLAEEILNAVEADGEILDSASPELAQLRTNYRKNRQRINSILRSFFDKGDYPDLLQDDFITIRNDRAVIPVKVEHKNRYKGIIHDRSRSGDSVYFEPMEVVEHNNALANLRAEIRLEELRIIRRLSGLVYSRWDDVIASLRNTAYLESLVARARMAGDSESVVPDFSDSSELIIRAARHPLIDERLRNIRAETGLDEEYSSQKIVPVDILINKDQQVLIVTGPNAGGKTVTLKTAGLLALMAQSGIPVPATEYRAPFFQTIAADIGDSQDISSHLSSFSSHLYWLRSTLQSMDQPALILIDEISAATDPGEGSALAMATLEYLRDQGAYAMASTHLEALKAFAHSQKGMQNCSVEFDPDTLRPTYKLSYGLPGKSNALETAKEMKLPRALLERAHYYMGDEGASISEIVGAMQEQLSQLESKKRDLDIDKKRMQEQHQKSLEKLAAQKQEVNAEIDRIRKEWKEYRKSHDKKLQEALELARSGKAEDEVRETMREAVRQREQQFEALNLKKTEQSRATGETTPLKKGASVVLSATGRRGAVEKDWQPGKDGVQVNFDGMRMTVPRESLRLEKGKSGSADKGVRVNVKTERKRPDTELVLVGKRVEDALLELDRFIDDSLVNRFPTIRVIHGRGTGTLRKAVEQHLSNHPMVETWRQANASEGGTAATVATLAG